MSEYAEMKQAFREYIQNLGGYCRDETYHGTYAVSYVFLEEEEPPRDGDGNVSHAEVKFNQRYLRIEVKVYRPMFEAYLCNDYKQIGRDLLHEFCHGFLDPVVQLFWWDVCDSQKHLFTDVIERQTQLMAYTVFDLLPNGWYLPERVAEGRRKVAA